MLREGDRRPIGKKLRYDIAVESGASACVGVVINCSFTVFHYIVMYRYGKCIRTVYIEFVAGLHFSRLLQGEGELVGVEVENFAFGAVILPYELPAAESV